MNTLKLYLELLKLPFKIAVTILIVGGLIVAIFMPVLPEPVQEWVIEWVENNWN